MSTTAVDVQNVSKRFRLFQEKHTSLKERVIHAGKVPRQDLWALDQVGFQVAQGETLGILGRNGSGKSTLLKCICGVLQPTTGRVIVQGTLAGLLELGAGFQQELSGRDNIYLNGSLLGLTRKEVDRRFDDIVAFAELEQFIDNQVKFYSSGMYVRLGFAVAVTIEPDILVIDEVLAVGDERFQRKCMDRVRQFQREGRTIILVSHSPDQVRSICDRALVMNGGQLIGLGTPGEAVRLFRERMLDAGDALPVGTHEELEEAATAEQGTTAAAEDEEEEDTSTWSRTPSGAMLAPSPMRPVRIADVTVQHPHENERPHLQPGEPLTVRVAFDAARPVRGVEFSVDFREDQLGSLFRTDTGTMGRSFDLDAGPGVVEFAVESFPFLDGTYEVAVGIQRRGVAYDWRESACRFEVMNPGKEGGIVGLKVRAAMIPTAVPSVTPAVGDRFDDDTESPSGPEVPAGAARGSGEPPGVARG